MEQSVFPQPAVASELKRYILVELVLDRKTTGEIAARSEKYKQYQIDNFRTTARPFYAILESDGATVVAKMAPQTLSGEDFLTFMKRAR